jgi:hypothetical protein
VLLQVAFAGNERCLISTSQTAERMGFKGDYRQWEHLLRMGD